jgi:two-component system nitrate/nitrite response regulator NarL
MGLFEQKRTGGGALSRSKVPEIKAFPARAPVADKKEKSVTRFPGAVIKLCLIYLDPLRVEGIRALFDDSSGIEIVPESDATSRTAAWLDPTVQVAVLGAKTGEATPKMIETLRAARPDLHILVMSPAAGDEAALTVLALGVKGFIHDSASPAEFEKAIRVVASGAIWATRQVQSKLIARLLREQDAKPAPANASFTKREQEVLTLLLDGRSNREIARSLDIEERTVKAYVTSLMAKVGVKNRISLSMRTLSKAGSGAS